MHACMLSHFSHVWLFEILWTIACQAPLPMGFSRKEYWSRLLFPCSEDLPDSGIKPRSHASCIGRCVLYHWQGTTISLWMMLYQFSSVQSPSHVRLFATPWIAARQASLSITNSQSLPKLMSIESVMPSNHLILCHPLLLLPSIFPSIRVFSNESALCIRWPKYWSSSFNISRSNEHPGLISFRMD